MGKTGEPSDIPDYTEQLFVQHSVPSMDGKMVVWFL